MSENPSTIQIDYDEVRSLGLLSLEQDFDSSIWERLKAYIYSHNIENRVTATRIDISWIDTLNLVREFGSRGRQQSLNFRFRPTEQAAERLKIFADEVRQTSEARDQLVLTISREEIKQQLLAIGFTNRELRVFQYRDLQHLLSLRHGANFSVPGAGKTTVTFALYLLLRTDGHLLIVCPKSAFMAWDSIVDECLGEDAAPEIREPFVFLTGGEEANAALLRSGGTRFVITYDLMVRQQNTISTYLATHSVHLVLDESHRMKAGLASLRGAFLINVAALPVRRDILSGTPMPQDSGDLASQLKFLWPGQGLDLRISRGESPRSVLGELYVRTTKSELELPPATRTFHHVDMSEAQLALYSVVRDEALRQFATVISRGARSPDFLSARRSIMRLLQISVNPTLALHGIAGDDLSVDSGIVDAVVEEGTSNKLRAVADHARALARQGRKSVIWTIFTNNIIELEGLLTELNPVTIYGGVPSGDSRDNDTREGRLKRFHEDASCNVLIANPAAAGEGISLHTVCHEAIYLDRSYVSTHYLQSIDRIHRLGLQPDTETSIHIYQSKAPPTIGSIDLSVSRRLAMKIRNLQQLLDDPDLHDIAFDEENADDPIDYDIDMQDLVDLVSELEGHPPSDSDED